MKRGVFLASVAVVAAWASVVMARPPVVVELFTAQGCSSCGKAEAHAVKLADEKDLVVLTFDVDYWDYLGWKDTFARPEFTDRQRAYAKHFGITEVYTPQVVVNGHVQGAGVKAENIDRLVHVERALSQNPPDMDLTDNGRVNVGSGRRVRGGAEVWLIRYDPREQDIEVKQGDNRGQTVTERNVVAQLERLGAWKGRPVSFKLPPAPIEGLQTLVVVQGVDGGRVVGVLRGEPPKP